MKYLLYIVCLLVIASGGMSIVAANTETATETMYVTVPMPPTTTTTVPTTTTTTAVQKVKVTATAYCSCEKCCGVWAKNRPNGIVYTASGAAAQPDHTIAVDTSVFPFGTVLLYNGIEYVAEDTGSAIKGNKIDIYFDSHEEAWNFGKKEIEVIVKKG